MNHTNESKFPIADGHERPQGVNLSHWLVAKLTRNIVCFPEIPSFLYNRGHASWNGQTGRSRALRGGNGGRHSRCGFRVLHKPILGTADSERWRCLGVRSFLFEIPQESMNKARQRLYYAANRADAIRSRFKISLPDSCRSPMARRGHEPSNACYPEASLSSHGVRVSRGG